jgi:hypothetical protein
MPAAPIPPAFERLGGRRFSFYPPILRVPANEWTFRGATWSEVLVRNAANGRDLWISRRFLGELSETDHPVVIVGLLDTLEVRDGSVYPCRPRVIEMPLTANPPANSAHPRPAPVISIRLEARNESRASRMAGSAVALGVLGCLAVVGYSLQGGDAHRRAVVSSLDKTYLALSGSDTYHSVIQALGIPDRERWIITPSGNRIRLLDYPDRGFQAVLVPQPGADDRYAGSVDESGRILQSVLMPRTGLSTPILRDLKMSVDREP